MKKDLLKRGVTFIETIYRRLNIMAFTEMFNRIRIQKCPFCKNCAKVYKSKSGESKYITIGCTQCIYEIQYYYTVPTERELIKEWNSLAKSIRKGRKQYGKEKDAKRRVSPIH